MGVEPKIGGKKPKSSILIGFGTIINHPFWGPTTIFGNTHIQVTDERQATLKPGRPATEVALQVQLGSDGRKGDGIVMK